ncbi:MAG: DUF1080 domain-containing protein [Verrucomicrobiales bacterium]|nr:DUF1080 domain-containing protein [Verrucomicrobiales bacterium]
MTKLTLLLIAVGLTSANSETTHLFDGETLKGFKVIPADQANLWRVEDGAITAGDQKTKIAKNSFLCTTADFTDFEFTCEFKIAGDPKTGMINSGIQFRSYHKNNQVVGYQADIGDPKWWGCIYDEHRRNKVLAASDMEKLNPVLKRDDWNTYTIRCVGPEITLTINGVKTVTYTEPDDKIARKGFIAPQIHSGGTAQVWFRKLTLTPISKLSASTTSEPELLSLLNTNGVSDKKLITTLNSLAKIPSLAEDTFATLAADPNVSPKVRAAAVRTLAASKTPYSKKRIAALWPDLPDKIKPALKHLK